MESQIEKKFPSSLNIDTMTLCSVGYFTMYFSSLSPSSKL